MASKQALAKLAQGYVPKPVAKICSNCQHFASVKTVESGYYGTWEKESNVHCGIGGFAVKKMATCLKHEPKSP